MSTYFIESRPGVGYVVMRLDSDRVPSVSSVRNFGCRQSDAMEFRNDCRNGKIDERRIRLLVDTYTDTPYRYLGKGNLRKTGKEE